jgi:hypothetical protein
MPDFNKSPFPPPDPSRHIPVYTEGLQVTDVPEIYGREIDRVMEAVDKTLAKNAAATTIVAENNSITTRQLKLWREIDGYPVFSYTVKDETNVSNGTRTVVLAYYEGYQGWSSDYRLTQTSGNPVVAQKGKLDHRTGEFIPAKVINGQITDQLLPMSYWPDNLTTGLVKKPSTLKRLGRNILRDIF